MNLGETEKRRFPRANFPCKIVIHTPEESVITAITENIGAGGVRVILSQAVEVSSMVDLEVEVGDSLIGCKGRVVWMMPKKDSQPSGSFGYDTGIEFHQISHKDQEVIKKLVNSIIAKDQ